MPDDPAVDVNAVKYVLRRAFQWFDKSIRHLPAVLDVNRGAELQISLDLLLDSLSLDVPELAVVQVGAFDGVANDPLASFIRRRSPRCLLVEPQPDAFGRLREAYADSPHVRTLNVAVGETDGMRELYTVVDDRALPRWAQQLASFDREAILKHARWIPDIAARIRPLAVPCASPRTLLHMAEWDRVDALVIDAEGFDLKILAAFLDAEILPIVAAFEHRHLRRKERDAGLRRLIGMGYKLAYQHMDILAYHPELREARAVRRGLATAAV